jgi:hypothetical protein
MYRRKEKIELEEEVRKKSREEIAAFEKRETGNGKRF